MRAAASAGPGWLTPTQQFCAEVLGGRLRQDVLVGVAQLADATGLADAARACRRAARSIGGIHAQPISVITNFSFGKRSNTPDEHQLHERALRVERHLGDVEQRRRPGTCRSRAGRCRRALFTGDPEVLAHLPQRVVVRVVQRLDARRRRAGRSADQHAAAQAVLLDPLHVVDRVVDVVEEDLADAGAPLRELGRRSRPASGCGRGCRRAGARTPRAWAGRRTARSSGRTAARCSGRSPRRRCRRLLEVADAALVVPVADAAARPAGRGTGSCTCCATRRSRRGTPGRGTRGTWRGCRRRGSRPR